MKILVITPIYPTPNATNSPTKVVHFFAKEWVKRGNDVRVVHLPSYFISVLYKMPTFIERIVSKRFGSPVPKNIIKEKRELNIDGIPVLSIPQFKLLPGGKISVSRIKHSCKAIIEFFEACNFKPDVIASHWTEPSLPFVSELKKHYNCPATMVTHANSIKYYANLRGCIDLWGYRCNRMVNEFNKLYPEIKFGFRCYSGVPNYFFKNIPTRDYSQANRYIYVGMMLERKYPDVVLEAVRNIHGDNIDYALKLIGDGVLLDRLRTRVKDYGINKQVSLPGKINREALISELDSSDIFIMVSSGEVFGLVYLEAMSRGCIIIASRNEGMEGIISHGENGFLIEAGNQLELENTIKYIQQLTTDERRKISENAFNTALELTDEKVAEMYLNEIQKLVHN